MKKEENKTINQFDSDHIDWLKDKLSFIQKINLQIHYTIEKILSKSLKQN